MSRLRTTAICAVAVGVLLLAGCGGSTKSTSTHTTTRRTVPTTAKPTGAAVLRHSVVMAVDADHKTSVRALWTNAVPAKPTATAGLALSGLRKSVAGRRAKRIRVRMLHERFRVISTALNPSYTTATAVISDVQRVQPAHENGKPLGKSVTLKERARIELRRVSGTNRFVVWKVQLVN